MSGKRHGDWERRNLLPCSFVSGEQRAIIEGRKMFPRREEIWQPRIVKHPQLAWKWHALLLHKAHQFCQSLQLLFIAFEYVYFDGFLFILFFPSVVHQKHGPIWRQYPTWCFPQPFQSVGTIGVGGALKKCQLAIKVPQTSIMSSSYESLGAAQNWAIMSTVKNGCWGPRHSLFPLIIAWCWCWSHCMCVAEPRQAQGMSVKMSYTSHLTDGADEWPWVPPCSSHTTS